MARVAAVNVAASAWEYVRPDGRPKRSGIVKLPTSRTVPVDHDGLRGDTIINTRLHGGPTKAVYAYAAEDLVWWSAQLGRHLTPGMFGENLTTYGVDVNGATPGQRWRVGSGGLILAPTVPRDPCIVFEHRMGIDGWLKQFLAAGRPGMYLRVINPGPVTAGDPIEVEEG